MNQSPFFSVVIPTYNRQDILPNTIKTVFDQDFEDYEIVVINDGSTDATEEILIDLAETNLNFRFKTIENSERGKARNEGIRESKGEFVVIFDSDDQMHNHYLSTLRQAIDRNDHINFFCCKYDFIRNGRNVPQPTIQSFDEGEYDYKAFLNGNHLAANICFRNDPGKFKFYTEDRQYSIMEDWMFLLENLRNEKLYWVNKVALSMLDHEGRSMRSDNNIIIERRLRATEWALANLNLAEKEKNELVAGSNYFAAIHYYIDGNKKAVKEHLKLAIKASGMKWNYRKLQMKLFFK